MANEKRYAADELFTHEAVLEKLRTINRQLHRSISAADPRPDLHEALAPWDDAATQLERIHRTLRAETQRLTEELELKDRQLTRSSRLAELGQMVSHVANQLQNNLTPASLYLSLLKRRLSDDPGSRDVLAKVEAGFLAVDAAVGDLLHFASDQKPRLQSIQIRKLVEEVCDSLALQFSDRAINAVIDVPAELRISADPQMLRRAVFNLTLNALQAMENGGSLTVTSCSGRYALELEVADNGPGLSEEARRRAFDPMFTTKYAAAGLGLAIVERIARLHGGEVVAINCPEGGAAFTLRIPRRAQQAAA